MYPVLRWLAPGLPKPLILAAQTDEREDGGGVDGSTTLLVPIIVRRNKNKISMANSSV